MVIPFYFIISLPLHFSDAPQDQPLKNLLKLDSFLHKFGLSQSYMMYWLFLGHYVHCLLSLHNFLFDTVLCKFEYFLCVPCQYFMCCHIKRLSYFYHIIFSSTIWSTCWNYYILTPLRFWGFVSHFSVIKWWYFSIFLEVFKSHDNSYVSLLCSFVPW